MKQVDTFDVFGQIDDALITEAQTARAAKWPRVLTVAACLAVMAVTLSFATGLWKIEPPTTVSPHFCGATESVMEDEFFLGLRAAKSLQYTGKRYVYSKIKRNENSIVLGTRLALIDNTTDCPYCDPVQDAQIHRVSGELYTVRGMDPADMVCLVVDGEKELYVAESQGAVRRGAELFSDRLHLQSNVERIGVMTHEQWNQSSEETVTVPTDHEAVTGFLEALNASTVLWDIDLPPEKQIYHVYWQLDNGVDIHMRLYEGGFVRWNYFDLFEVDDAAFDAFVNLLADVTAAEPTV